MLPHHLYKVLATVTKESVIYVYMYVITNNLYILIFDIIPSKVYSFITPLISQVQLLLLQNHANANPIPAATVAQNFNFCSAMASVEYTGTSN